MNCDPAAAKRSEQCFCFSSSEMAEGFDADALCGNSCSFLFISAYSKMTISSLSASIIDCTNVFEKLQLPLPRLNILGVAEWKVTLQDIKKAYRDISLKVHPDKCGSERANDAFLGNYPALFFIIIQYLIAQFSQMLAWHFVH